MFFSLCSAKLDIKKNTFLYFSFHETCTQQYLIDTLVFLGPSLFFSCPMDYKAAEGWFVNVWNYNVIPYLHQALRSGRKVLHKMLFILWSVTAPISTKGEFSFTLIAVISTLVYSFLLLPEKAGIEKMKGLISISISHFV